MISRLYLDNCFKHQDRTFTFEDGLTGVIGRNEAGKSLIVEMIRYALFGSKALRGKADDYKKLHVELDFEVQGQSYAVVRKGTKAELTGATTASGTKPVNAAIERILGYNLDVFDVANVCNQGDVEALSDMKPAERKTMVDRTVGLDQLDGLIRYCGEEGNALRREADGMERGLVEPVEPQIPEGYFPASSIEPRLTGAREERDEFLQLKSHLDNAPAAPTAPGPAPTEETAEDLQCHETRRTSLVQSIGQKQSEAKGITPQEFDEEQLQTFEKQLDAADRAAALRHERAQLEPEVHTSAELDEFEARMDQADAWKQKQKLLAQGHHECPSCAHQWPVADLGDLEHVEETSGPSMTRQQLAQHRARSGNNARIGELDEEIFADEAVGQSDLTRQQVRDQRARAGNNDRIAELDKEMTELSAELNGMEDRSEDLQARQVWDQEQAAYGRALIAFEKYNKGLDEKRARFEELNQTDWTEEVRRLEAELEAAKTYERDRMIFRSATVEYEGKLEQVTSLRDRGESFLTARERIKELKVSMKSHLLPSLNKVSSVLLSRMTGGERGNVAIDEDFEIEIDGQGIQTLSGSGKAVGNLAIRIALGQILTNRVFSVFMADEVDAAMDDERATYTAEALTRLRETVRQVVLVTHKRPDTNRTIEL